MKKEQKSEYQKISEYLREYESYKPYKQKDIDWICDRIDWAWHWRKITQLQKDELCDRVCFILENEIRRF